MLGRWGETGVTDLFGHALTLRHAHFKKRQKTRLRSVFAYRHRLLDRWGHAVASFTVLADDSKT